MFYGCYLKCFEAASIAAQLFYNCDLLHTVLSQLSFAVSSLPATDSQLLTYCIFLAAANHNKFSSQRHCSLFSADKSRYFAAAVFTIYFFSTDNCSPFQLQLYYTVQKCYLLSRPQPVCHLPSSPWQGLIKLFPARQSLVSDIPAWDGKIDTFVYSV